MADDETQAESLRPGQVLRRSAEVVCLEVHEGAGLMDLRTGGYFGLNRTGALVWDLLEQSPTVEQLLAEVRSLAGPAPNVEAEVIAFVGDLRARNLIEVRPDKA